jgi:glucose-1-phosphate cytidylyltransferase
MIEGEAMQVVILCGGQGTRIRDVAADIPKPMIPVGDQPILWHIMKGYAQHGFTDFVLCLGYKSWTIKRYFLDYQLSGSDFTITLGRDSNVRVDHAASEEPWRITLVETGLDAMTGCRVKRVEKYINGDEFMLTYGDGVSDVNITRLVEYHRGHGRVGTVTTVQPPGRFGEVEVDRGRVTEFMEKPLLSRGRISGGFFVFRRAIFSHLRDDPTLIFEHGPLAGLAHDGELMAYHHDGFWHAMDSSRDHQHLNQLWRERVAPWATWQSQVQRRAA